MCNVTAPASGTRSTPRPQWGRLYIRVAFALAAFGVVERLMSPGPIETVLECGVVVAGLVAIGSWTRRNRVALDQQEWCDCATAKVTVRVISSRRPERRSVERVVRTPIEAALEEVGR
jgi:cobalamin biosynthesis protein CobD/CbiB